MIKVRWALSRQNTLFLEYCGDDIAKEERDGVELDKVEEIEEEVVKSQHTITI